MAIGAKVVPTQIFLLIYLKLNIVSETTFKRIKIFAFLLHKNCPSQWNCLIIRLWRNFFTPRPGNTFRNFAARFAQNCATLVKTSNKRFELFPPGRDLREPLSLEGRMPMPTSICVNLPVPRVPRNAYRKQAQTRGRALEQRKAAFWH